MKNKPKGKSVEGCVKTNRHRSVLVETANHFVNFGTLSAPHPLPWQEKDPCTSLGNPSSWRMRIPEAGLMMASDAHTWPLLAPPSVARPRESQPAGAPASLSVHPELSSRCGVSHSQRHVRSSHLQPANEGWCWEFKRPQQM